MKEPQKCSVCENMTKYLCVDCLLDTHKRIFVCNNDTCRNKHIETCSVPVTDLKYKYSFV